MKEVKGMVEIDSLEIKITANTEEFDRKMKSISSTLHQLTQPMQEATKEVSSAMDEVSKKKMNIDTSSAKKSIKEMVQTVIEANRNFGKNWEWTKGVESAKNNISNYEQQLANAKSKMMDLIDAGDVYGKTFNTAVKNVMTLTNKLEILKKAANVMSDINFDPDNINIKLLDNSGIERTVEYYEEEFDRLRDALRNDDGEMTNSIGLDVAAVIDELKERYPELESLISQYEKLYQEYLSSYEPSGPVDTSMISENTALQKKIESVTQSITQLKEESLKLQESISRHRTDKVSKEYENLEKMVLRATNSLIRLQERMLRGLTGKNGSKFAETEQFQLLDEEIVNVSTHLENLKSELAGLNTNSINQITENTGIGVSNFRKYVSAFNGVVRGLDHVMGRLYKATQKLISLITRAGSIIISPFRKLSDSIKAVIPHNIKLFDSLQRTFKMFKLMITRTILRGIIRLGTEGFKNLIQYSEELNQSFSLMWNSVRQLGNANAAMFAPLVNAIAPAINYIIQLVIKATNVINQVMSALTGKGTWIRAKELTDSYADSIKKLNKQLAKFDELNNLSSKDSEGTQPKDMFETLEIEQKWKNLADKIKDIINKLLSTVSKAWDRVKDRFLSSAKNMVSSLKELFKSIGSDFLEVWQQEKTIQIFEKIFRIVANIMDTVANLADRFREAWDENERGKQILEAIRDIIWIIVDNIEDLSEKVKEWSANLNFAPLLEAFKNLLVAMQPMIDALMKIVNNFITEVLLPLSKWTLEKGIPDLLNIMSDLINRIDWDWIIDRLSEFNKHLEPFAERVGEGLLLFIDQLKERLVAWLNNGGYETFSDWLKDIEDWMDNTSAQGIANELMKLFDVLMKVATALGKVAGWIVGKLAGNNLAETIDNISKLAVGFGALWGAIKVFEGIGAIAAVVAPFFAIFAAKKALKGAAAGAAEGGVLGSVNALTLGFKDLLGVLGVAAAVFGGFYVGKHLYMLLTGEKIDMSWIEQFNEIKNSFTDGSWKEALSMWGSDIKDGFAALGHDLKEKAIEIKNSIFGNSEDISKELEQSLAKTGTNVATEFSKTMKDLEGKANETSKNVEKSFSDLDIGTAISKGIDEGIKKLEGFSKEAETIIRSVASSAASIGMSGISAIGNLGIKYRGYATGGFPEDGWFRASKGELIGKFDDGSSVVANNEQIVKGIENGVYRAVKSAMDESKGSDIYLDGKVLFKSTRSYAKEYEKKTGKPAF